MRAFLLYLALSVPVSILAGCALFKANPVADQLAVQELTAVAIQSGCATTATQTAQACYDARAAKVLTIANSLKSVTVGMAASDITTLLGKTLAALKLTPEESAPIQAFVGALVQQVVTNYGSGVLGQTAVTYVQTIAGWIAQEAGYY